MRGVRRSNSGFSLIELLIVLSVIAIIATIAIMILGVRPKRAANEASAISSCRTLVTAERVYAMTAGNGNFGSLETLAGINLIDPNLGTGTKQGYTFELSASEAGFALSANPESEYTGTRSFYADETGVIRWREGSGAGPGDPPLGAN